MYARQFVTLFSNKSLARLFAELFAAGESGSWLDWSDLSTLYQDSAGIAPVTATGQPDGLVLDKSKGLIRGPEMTVNGDFGAGATGWTVTGADGTHIVTFAGGTCRYQSDTNSPVLSVTNTTGTALVSGKTYEIVIVVSAYTSGAISGDHFGQFTGITSAGTYRFIKQAAIAGVFYFYRFGTNVDITIDSISIREIPGNHALQATSASRPVLQQAGALYYSALDGVDDRLATVAGGGASASFMLGIGFVAGGAGTARVLWSDRGTNTGLQLELNTSNQIQFSGGNGSAFTTVTGDTTTAGNAYVAIAYYDGAKLAVQVNQAAEANTPFNALSAGAAIVSIGSSKTPDKFFKDRVYGVVWRNNAFNTPAQRDSLRAYLNSKTGAF